MVIALVRLIAEPTPARRAVIRDLAPSVDLGAVLRTLELQRVVPSLGALLTDDPEIALPADVDERIRVIRTRARQRGLLGLAVTSLIARELGESGIPVMPLKGATLAETVYGDIGARQSADIDLLVRLQALGDAVTIAERHGWREPELLRKAGTPTLHHELFHAEYPPLELHWRVHWYEESFANAALARADQTANGWLRAQPGDEIAFLLLFLARDGFAGLRHVVDVAAWWATLGRPQETAAGLRAVVASHPALADALTAAARYAERAADLPSGSLAGDARPSLRGRAAIRLADPWVGGSRAQISAQMSLADALLAPRRGLPAFIRRQLLIPRSRLVRLEPRLERASAVRIGAARLAHTGRVLARYALASRALLPHRGADSSGIS